LSPETLWAIIGVLNGEIALASWGRSR
jgi:hypothetical protein